MTGLGPILPLLRNSEHGAYALTTTYVEQIKQNFKNLLLTAPGERVMSPDFGVGLRHYLFEQKKDAIPKIRQRVNNQVKKYLPFVEISRISFDEDKEESFAQDSQVLSISIEYSVPSLNLNSTLVLTSDGINKL